MSKAYINHEILNWAMERSEINPHDLAERISISEEKIQDFLSGADLPSFSQANKIATSLHIPFGYLYLPSPPSDQIPVAEFRRAPGISKKIGKDIFDLLSDIEFKRDWYRDYRLEEGLDRLDFVGRYDVKTPTELVASDIRRELSTKSNSLFLTRKSHERFLGELMKAAEQIGIWIMRSGVIGNNTHRPIDVSVLRGFAIADPVVPIIFLNGQDAKSAQIFTLAHELAHLWIGKSSIEFGDLSEVVSNGDLHVERICNSIAADVLVPKKEFFDLWNGDILLTNQVDRIAEHFSVSRIVIARRALEQGLVSEVNYRSFYAEENARWQEISKRKPKGGSYYNNIPARNGKTFTNAVAREAAVGRLLYREAGQLLGVQPSKIREIFERGLRN